MEDKTRPKKLDKYERKEELINDQKVVEDQDLFYPGIESFAEKSKDINAVSVNDEKLILKIRSHTGLSKEDIKYSLDALFQEFRSVLISGSSVNFPGIGKLAFLSKKRPRKHDVLLIPEIANLRIFNKNIHLSKKTTFAHLGDYIEKGYKRKKKDKKVNFRYKCRNKNNFKKKSIWK